MKFAVGDPGNENLNSASSELMEDIDEGGA